jgi:hypothetical protein
MIADLLRCNLLPECYTAPVAIRNLRRMLRYRNLVVRQATRMKSRIAGLLMETGTPYNKERLHGKAYFSELLGSLQEVPGSDVTQAIRLLKLYHRQFPNERPAEHWARMYPQVIPGYDGMNPVEQRDARERLRERVRWRLRCARTRQHNHREVFS